MAIEKIILIGIACLILWLVIYGLGFYSGWRAKEKDDNNF